MRGLLGFLSAPERETRPQTVLFVATSLPETTERIFARAYGEFVGADFTVIAPDAYHSLFPDRVSFLSNEEIKSHWWRLTRRIRKTRVDVAVIILDGRPVFRLPKLWSFLTNYRSLWVYDEDGRRTAFQISSSRHLMKHLWSEIRGKRALHGATESQGQAGQPDICPLCSCPYTQIVAAKRVEGTMFRVMQCCNLECLHGFLTPLPTLQLLERIYGQEKLNDYLTAESTIRANCEFFSHLFEAYFPRAFSEPGVLLDIGAGIGTFVSVAKKFGWRAEGIEINQQSVQWAAEKFGVELRSGDFYDLGKHFHPQSIDLITLNHVFEHILDPSSYIQYVRSFLRPDGCILLSVPNILSDDFRRQMPLWSYLHIPAHISYFSRFSMDALILQKARFARGHFEKIFQTSFPAPTQEEGEGLTSMYRWVCEQ
jgi:2-polyprenyl-3-methyl-5-hydroxy-6-metoxy-1,4-benzoquinol methylase